MNKGLYQNIWNAATVFSLLNIDNMEQESLKICYITYCHRTLKILTSTFASINIFLICILDPLADWWNQIGQYSWAAQTSQYTSLGKTVPGNRLIPPAPTVTSHSSYMHSASLSWSRRNEGLFQWTVPRIALATYPSEYT